MSKLYTPEWVKPELMINLGYKDDNHPDGAEMGYYKYVSQWPYALHRENRKHQQNLGNGKRVIWFNCSYSPEDNAVYCLIEEDGGTRKVFNGVIENAEQLKLILRLVE